MKEQLYQLFQGTTGAPTVEDLLLRVGVSVVIGLAIFVSYWISHAGTIYSQKFNINLITLTILTATVMTVIGNNIALSLGMVGALSIVRFRTAIKDSRDTVYIFWAIVVGICCGSGDYLIAAAGSAVVFLVLLLFGRIRNDNRALLIMRTARINEEKIEALIFQYYARRAILRVKNTTESSIELIYELNARYLDSRKQPPGQKSITDAVYEIGNIEYFNIVMQSDEISS